MLIIFVVLLSDLMEHIIEFKNIFWFLSFFLSNMKWHFTRNHSKWNKYEKTFAWVNCIWLFIVYFHNYYYYFDALDFILFEMNYCGNLDVLFFSLLSFSISLSQINVRKKNERKITITHNLWGSLVYAQIIIYDIKRERESLFMLL